MAPLTQGQMVAYNAISDRPLPTRLTDELPLTQSQTVALQKSNLRFDARTKKPARDWRGPLRVFVGILVVVTEYRDTSTE
jgi:hypothetical protein